ncbi:hypothetical protein ES703_18242 [subsurface metagenome]
MKRGVLRKIRRVYQYWVEEKTKAGVKRYGPYWRGSYYENGRERTVYIGKEVPGGLRYLLDGRYRRPGYEEYTWPGRKEGGEKNVKTPGKR